MSHTNRNYSKLIMVTSDNNNKFYEMKWEGGSTFTATWGRVESTSKSKTYSHYEWNKIYNEKVNKGYKDVTDLVAVEVKEDKSKGKKSIKDTGVKSIDEFLKKMKDYTDNLVSKTYSVKCTSVSKAQIDKAQEVIDKLTKIDKSGKIKEKETNNLLLELYSIIPRYMGNTRDYLLPTISNLTKHLEGEQDNLDAMASQVAMYNKNSSKKDDKKTDDTTKTLPEMMGVSISEFKGDTSEIDYLLKQIKSARSCKLKTIFEVNSPKEDNHFKEWTTSRTNKATKILIHGTKCTSVIPIMEQGLKIRPVGNFSFSGKAFGDGNYFSEVVDKSLGYTGWDSDKILFVYEVHTGNPFVYSGRYNGNSFALNLKELTARGYDSTYVPAGNGMLNSEIIAYSEKQNRLKYILWLQ